MTSRPSLFCAAAALLVATSPLASAQPRPRATLPAAIDSIAQSCLKDGRAAGMGLALHTFGGHRTIEHGGAIPGYLSEAAYCPHQDAFIVVLINSAGTVAPAAVTQAIANVLFGTMTPTALAMPSNIAAFAGR